MTEPSADSDFRSISPAEFFYRNQQMAGFGNPTQALYTTIRELIENSLDSCEEAGAIPEVDIRISSKSSDSVEVVVEDNGTGVPSSKVPESFGRILFGSKYSSRQRRGTFGLGATMAVLYGQITTGQPVDICTKTDVEDGAHYRIFLDVETNAPIIESFEKVKRHSEGTTVSITLTGDFKRARERIEEYLRLTGLSTPYARITFNTDEGRARIFGGHSSELPRMPTITKPHPRAADLELLRRIAMKHPDMTLYEFLTETFQRIGSVTARRFIKFINMTPNRPLCDLGRSELTYISRTLQKYDGFGRPSSECLSLIGKDQFLQAIRTEFGRVLTAYSQRGPLDWSGFPYLIEGALAVGNAFKSDEVPAIYRFANRVPLLYDASDDVFSKVMKRVPWNRYGLSMMSGVGLFVHFCSTRVPYSAAGKQSIASVGTIDSEILALYRSLGRSLRMIAHRQKSAARQQKNYREFSKAFGLIAKFGASLAGRGTAPEVDTMVKSLFEVDSNV
jgi:DNA topoisomerase-6 subunit B